MSKANKTFFTLVAAGVLLLASQLVSGHWSAPLASAETLRTSKRTRVLSSPRPTGRVIARLAAGRDVEVVARKGRWIKVRHHGKTGWITRSSVTSTHSARKSVTRTKRPSLPERRSKSKKKKRHKKRTAARSHSRSKHSSRSERKPAAKPSKPAPVKSKVRRPKSLDDDEEFLVGEEIDAAAERKRVAAREKKEQLRREREQRERERREAEQRKREAARAERERRERERRDREIERRREEEQARLERERRRRPPKRGYERYDADADYSDEEPDRDRDRYADEESSRGEQRYREDEGDRRARSGRADDYDDLDEEDDDRGASRRRVVVVRVDAAGVHAKPSSHAEELGIAEDGERLYVVRVSSSGNWMLVEDQDGKTGWIRSKDVSDGSGHDSAGESKVIAHGGVTAGYTSMGAVFSSNGVGELANYEFTTGAGSIAVGGEIIFEYTSALLLGCDARYSGTRADPGIRFVNSAGDAADIAFTNHEVDAGARLGLRLGGNVGTVLYGRVGYHYGMFSIDDVSNFEVNLAMLPSEVLKGMTVGGQIDIAGFGSNLGIRVGADYLYPNGTRVQTDGLEDGAQSKATALWATGQIIYRTKANLTVEALYRYSYANTDWTGTAEHSMRPHEASEAHRKDVAHTAMIGLGRTF